MPGITVIPYPSKPYYLKHLRDPKPFSFGVVERDILEFRPDVIHVDCPERLFMGFLSRPGIRAAKKLNIPITSFYHTNYLAYIPDYKDTIKFLNIPGIIKLLFKMMVWVYNSYDLTIVSSKVTQNYLIGCGIKNTYQSNFLGIDTKLFQPIESQSSISELEPLKGKIKIIYIGRLTADKQIDTLLRVFDVVRMKTNKCGFILVGGGSEESKIRNWVSKYDDAIFLGPQPNTKLPSYYSASDIFITASPKESFGLTVLEAMACGLPVVGTSEGGVGELILDNETGFLVSGGNVDKFAEAILKLVGNPDLRQKMKMKAIQRAQTFSYEQAAANMLRLWEEMIKKKSLDR
jgi:glycosyltransferase involved in cell wall biosynthesis